MLSIAIHGTTDSGLLKQWEYVLSHWQPNALLWLGTHPIPEASNVLRLACRRTWTTLPRPIVLLAPRSGRYVQGRESIEDFSHPESACYVFGSDSDNVDPSLVEAARPEHIVFIPTQTNDQMFAHVACAVTMWDRRRQLGAGRQQD